MPAVEQNNIGKLAANDLQMIKENRHPLPQKMRMYFNYLIFPVCFQAQCESFRSAKLSIKSLYPEAKISVNVTGVKFKASVWSVHNCDLSLTKCDIRSLFLAVHARSSTRAVLLNITECQIGGQMSIYNVTATIQNCSLRKTKTSVLDNGTCISALNSTLTIKASIITNFQGSYFLKINMTGTGFMSDVKFENCSPTMKLIVVSNESMLLVDNCTFLSNKNSLLHFEHSGFGMINNSHFSHNRIYALTTFSFLVGCDHSGLLFVRRSGFSHNTCNSTAGCGIVGGIYLTITIIETSQFLDNRARAILLEKSSNIAITSCKFSKNSADAGAAISVAWQMKLMIDMNMTAQFVKLFACDDTKKLIILRVYCHLLSQM